MAVGFEDLEGKLLCSCCGPTEFRDRTKTKFGGKWHDRFERTYLPLGMFKTNDAGNLEHRESGETRFRKYALKEPDKGKAYGIMSPAEITTPKVTGYVTYDVRVDCPKCNKVLHLNQAPYDDDETKYCPAEDELGLALFGREKEPAKWSGLDIEYQCCACNEFFYLASLET